MNEAKRNELAAVAGSAPLTKNQQKRKAIAQIITIIRNWQIDGTDEVEHAEGMRVIAALRARSQKLSSPNPIYSTIIRAKGLFDGCETVSEMIKALKGQIEYLEDLRAHGIELSGPVEDDYGFLETDDEVTARKFDMHLEEETEE